VVVHIKKYAGESDCLHTRTRLLFIIQNWKNNLIFVTFAALCIFEAERIEHESQKERLPLLNFSLYCGKIN